MMERNQKLKNTVECMLFVAGDPVPLTELARALEISRDEAGRLLVEMERDYRHEGRGVQLLVTEETAQLISNSEYISAVTTLLQPQQQRSVSQSLLETLAVVAYRQPVTRADIENVRGVRCDYAVSQLLKLGLISEAGRKNVVGRPMLFATTDRFLRQFGIHSLDEMPEFFKLSSPDEPEAEAISV